MVRGRRFIELGPSRSATADADADDRAVWVQGPVETATSAVLLVHDRTANVRAWDAVMRRLPERTAVVAVDLRGRGARWRARPSTGLVDHADDIVDVLDRLDIDHVLAVGHGFGAAVARELATVAADRVALTLGLLGASVDDPVAAVLGAGFLERGAHEHHWRTHAIAMSADADALVAFVAHGIAGPEFHHRWRVDLRSLVADDHASSERPLEARDFDAALVFGAAEVGGGVTRVADVDAAVATMHRRGADAIAAAVSGFLA